MLLFLTTNMAAVTSRANQQCTMELKINEESDCKRQNSSFFPTSILAKHYIRRYKQQGENKKT